METSVRVRESGHPTPAKYTAIALILSVITIAEVAIAYAGLAFAFLLAILLILSATKFALVAMFFMHLKFDNRLFSVFFIGGMLLTSGVIMALLLLFGIFTS